MIEFNSVLDTLKAMYPEILANLFLALIIFIYLNDLEKELDIIIDKLKKKKRRYKWNF